MHAFSYIFYAALEIKLPWRIKYRFICYVRGIKWQKTLIKQSPILYTRHSKATPIALDLELAYMVRKTSMPTGFQLSSNMHVNYAFGSIFILYHQWTLLYSLFCRHILFSVFMPITLDTVYNMYNAHELLSWKPQIFYIYKPYLFFDIYNPSSVPCLAVLFLFFSQMSMKFYCNS